MLWSIDWHYPASSKWKKKYNLPIELGRGQSRQLFDLFFGVDPWAVSPDITFFNMCQTCHITTFLEGREGELNRNYMEQKKNFKINSGEKRR